MVVRGSAGRAVVELDLDDKEFKGKTKQATAGLQSNMKALGGTIMGVVAALGLLAAAKGAVNMLTTLAKKAIEVADSFEMMEKQLTTLTKSEYKAKAFFEAIKDFAKETPYQVRDLAQSFNMLYPIFKDKTVPMLKLIGDTAAGTGRSFMETGSAMMRMATGDWGVEIMRQLFLVKTEFGDIFGPTGTLVSSQEEAWAKLEEILGDRFGGMMIGMMDTVQGKVSNLKDVLDSLGAAVGSELTPVTKDFLDLMIEAVKKIEESGELKEIAKDVAEALKENKDILIDILNALPGLTEKFGLFLVDAINGAIELARTLAEVKGWLDKIADWGAEEKGFVREDVEKRLALKGFRYDPRTREWVRKRGEEWEYAAVSEMGAEFYKREGAGWGKGPGRKVPMKPPAGWEEEAPGYRTFASFGDAPSDIKAGIDYFVGQGYDADMLRFSAPASWQPYINEKFGYPEEARRAARPRKKGKARKRKWKPTVEKGLGGIDILPPEELAAAEIELADIEAIERREEERRDARREELEQLTKEMEKWGDMIDPTSYIIAGLKSGEMDEAIKNFAVNLGTRVAEEMLSKLWMMGFMAILNVLSGGAAGVAGGGWTMGPMGRGGVVKAARGLVGILPPRPGGWHIPFGDKIINAAEIGQPEVAAFLPPGKAGQNIILNQLAPMFNIPKLEANVETRPVNQVTVRVEHADRHYIRAHNEAQAGKVNKALTVRE